ncbi:hypothetical protein GCM10027605_14770 [Micromonospora zhanjiangensis]
MADAGLAVGLVVVLAGTAVALATSWGGSYWLFGCVTGASVCVLAVLRHRHRFGTAVAGLAVAAASVVAAWAAGLPAEPGPAMALGLAVLLASAVRTLPAAPAGAVATAGLLVVAATRLLPAHPTSAALTRATVWNAVAWSAAVAVGLASRALAARRRSTAERVRRDVRLDLARELHDVVAHHVTGIVVQTQAARIVARRHPDRLDGSLAEIEAAGAEALAAMRRVVGLLRDAADAAPATPGPERLDDLVARFAGRAGPAVRLRTPDSEASWPPEVAGTVYRVVQEALTNVARHAAQARTVSVDVVDDGRTVRIEVTDDGPSGPPRLPHHRSGYGLVGMRERVESLGGTLHAGPRVDVGWSVLAVLPAPTPDAGPPPVPAAVVRR